MTSARKPDRVPAITQPLGTCVSGNHRIRRTTPQVLPAASDLALCRAAEPESVRAAIQSAYRPKPASGGGYSVIVNERARTASAAPPSSRTRPKLP